jgi:hypothetical protein
MEGPVTCHDGESPKYAKRSNDSTKSSAFSYDTATPPKPEKRGASRAAELTTLASYTPDTSRAAATTQPDTTRTTSNRNASLATDTTKDASGSSAGTSTASGPGSPRRSGAEAEHPANSTPLCSIYERDRWPSGTADWSPELKQRITPLDIAKIQRLRRERHEALLNGSTELIAKLNRELYALTGKPGYQ